MNHDSDHMTQDNPTQLERLLENQRHQEFLRLTNRAESASNASLFLLAVALLALLVAFFTPDNGMLRFFLFLIGGGLFVFALILLVIAQLIHIRASLEKLSLR
jgi:hypothetical protein